MVEARQGLAGAVINSLLFLGISFFLGWADVVLGMLEQKGWSEGDAFRVVLWYAAGCAGVAFAIVAIWVRVGRAESEMTADERAQIERETGTAR